jgi:uncharacterized SAM-dependent methyltransferase
MDLKGELLKSFVKSGYAKKNSTRIWDISERKFLYMSPDLAKKSVSFKSLPLYKKNVIDREVALMRAYGDTLKGKMDSKAVNLIDIYCSNGERAIELIKTLGSDVKVRYCPVNVSPQLAALATENMKKAGLKNVVDYRPVISDGYGHVLKDKIGDLKDGEFKDCVILLLGSVLGSYEINDYLFDLSQCMSKGDLLVIGNGVRTGDRLTNLHIYKDKIWHDWFIHLMNEIGFKEDEVEYDARFNTVRVEFFYKVKLDKKLKAGDKSVEIKKGDEILVAILYKYYAEEFDKFCSMYFNDVKLVLDKEEEYALVICKK